MGLGIIEIKGNKIVISEKVNQNLEVFASNNGICVTELVNRYIKEGLKNVKI